MDSGLIALTSKLGMQQAQRLHTSYITFNPDIFSEKLTSYMGDCEQVV
jgi:hypothetical protein